MEWWCYRLFSKPSGHKKYSPYNHHSTHDDYTKWMTLVHSMLWIWSHSHSTIQVSGKSSYTLCYNISIGTFRRFLRLNLVSLIKHSHMEPTRADKGFANGGAVHQHAQYVRCPIWTLLSWPETAGPGNCLGGMAWHTNGLMCMMPAVPAVPATQHAHCHGNRTLHLK